MDNNFKGRYERKGELNTHKAIAWTGCGVGVIVCVYLLYPRTFNTKPKCK